jgi:hypothetical protein
MGPDVTTRRALTAADLQRALRAGAPCVFTEALDEDVREALQWARLRQRAATEPVPVLPVQGSRVLFDPARGFIAAPRPLDRFLQSVQGDQPDGYLSARPEELPRWLAALVRAPRSLDRFPWRVSKLWIGAAGNLSALHRDLAHNLHTVIAGAKRFWLLSPAQGACVYPNPPWRGLPNGCAVDPEAPDLDRFPRFARARPVVIHVHAGETLFLPRGWWHHVRALDASVAVNTFFAAGAHAALVASTDVAKRLLGVSR